MTELIAFVNVNTQWQVYTNHLIKIQVHYVPELLILTRFQITST